MKYGERGDFVLPPGTIMCFRQDEPPEGWEFMHVKPENEVPPAARDQRVITCRKL